MNKMVSFDQIGALAATFPVDSATQETLKSKFLNTATGDVDINGKNLAVKLNEDGTVGFGTGTTTDGLFGVIVAYEMDGYASVQIRGGVDNVPTSAAIKGGFKQLVAAADGKVAELEGGNKVAVVIPSTADELYASVIF